MLGNVGGNNTGTAPLCGGDASAVSTTGSQYPALSAGDAGLRTLTETQRIANETEQLGATIMGQLGTQRGQLNQAIDRRAEAQDSLSVSNRLIRQMHRRATWMRASLCLIIIMLIAALIAFCVIKFLPEKHHHDPPPPPSSPAVLAANGSATDVAAEAPAASSVLAAEVIRRLSEGVATTSPPPPLPPPAALTARGSSSVGPGIIILAVVGGLSLIACIGAIPRGLVVRCAVFTLATLTFASTALVLLLMPREDAPGGSSSGKITDASTILRVVMITAACVFALASLACVGVVHGMAMQRAPAVVEPEAVETYRLAVSKA